MEKINITAKLGKLATWYDYTIVCKDIKQGKNTGKVCLYEPVEYSRENLLKMYDSGMTVIKWAHTFTEAGEPAMAVVLEH